MGQISALLVAVLLLGGGPIVEDSGEEAPLGADVDTSVGDAHAGTGITSGEVSVEPSPGNATEANTSTRTSVHAGSLEAEATADALEGEGNVSVSIVEMNVRLGDGQVVELTYTPPTIGSTVHDLPTTAPEAEPSSETDSTDTSPGGGDDGGSGLAWAIAPATGLAAAAAVGSSTPGARWLRRLVGALPLVPLYSRISSDDALDHETREAIFDLLEAQPGLSLESIADELDLARSTARHHVRKLEDTGLIAHAHVGRARVHHRVGERARALREHLLSNETRAQVLAAIEDEPLTISEIADAIEANPGSVHFHLGKLEEQGLAETVDEADRRYRARDLEEAPEAVFEPV